MGDVLGAMAIAALWFSDFGPFSRRIVAHDKCTAVGLRSDSWMYRPGRPLMVQPITSVRSARDLIE